MTHNITATIVTYKLIPVMLENGWEIAVFNPNPNAFRSNGYGSAVMIKKGDYITRNSDGTEKGIKLKRGEENGDETAPEVKTATVPAAGDKIRIVMTENVVIGVSGSRGFKLITPTDTIRLDFDQINGDTVFCKIPRTILSTETGLKLSYIQPLGGIQDISGNDLASFEDQPVTNNSGQ